MQKYKDEMFLMLVILFHYTFFTLVIQTLHIKKTPGSSMQDAYSFSIINTFMCTI